MPKTKHSPSRSQGEQPATFDVWHCRHVGCRHCHSCPCQSSWLRGNSHFRHCCRLRRRRRHWQLLLGPQCDLCWVAPQATEGVAERATGGIADLCLVNPWTSGTRIGQVPSILVMCFAASFGGAFLSGGLRHTLLRHILVLLDLVLRCTRSNTGVALTARRFVILVFETRLRRRGRIRRRSERDAALLEEALGLRPQIDEQVLLTGLRGIPEATHHSVCSQGLVQRGHSGAVGSSSVAAFKWSGLQWKGIKRAESRTGATEIFLQLV
mmetsp:Transcript_77381/g.169347  ORF Transcript_77381/g.169347 Transcript_77381/m.169347 type:complete len:267 (+) Transcript_77381:193-993(+)